jgi:hypothetical protein
MEGSYNTSGGIPALERVIVGPDRIARMQDRLGQYFEFGGNDLVALVDYAFANRERILAGPNDQFFIPVADNLGNDIRLFGDELDAIIRKIAQAPTQPVPQQGWSSGWNF